MDNEQLLLSIENMMDRMLEHKLQMHLEPIKKDIAELKVRVTRLEADVAELKRDVVELKKDVVKLNKDIAGLKDEMLSLDARMTNMEYKFDVLTREVSQLKDNIIDLTGRTASLEKSSQRTNTKLESMEKSLQEQGERIKRIEIIHLENNLIPRVNHIESCYMSTFERYKAYNDRLPELFATVSNVSRTVQTHSEKLKKIS